MKKTWKTINETLSRNKFISELPSTFLHDDLELTDPIEIANAFNTHFANIGKTFASQIKNSITSDKDFTHYLNTPGLKSCKFKCVSQAEVMTAIENLENKNSSGHDGQGRKSGGGMGGMYPPHVLTLKSVVFLVWKINNIL